jgi:hypothetical protein
MARAHMVRTATHKLIVRLTGDHELYCLTDDPWELHNRWGDPTLRDVVLDLQQRLVMWLLETHPDGPYQEAFGA